MIFNQILDTPWLSQVNTQINQQKKHILETRAASHDYGQN